MRAEHLHPDTSGSLLEWCVAQATLAPSTHNTQPWHFRVRGEGLDLIADRSRALAVSDPLDRELTISCGAALFSLRVAAAARGYATLVDLLPAADEPDLLARITPVAGALHAMADADVLGKALPERRTYRKAFVAEPVAEPVVQALCTAARQEGATLVALQGESLRHGAVELVEQADQQLWQDVHWRREISAWMHPRRRNEGFGIPGLAQAAAQLVARSFDIGGGIRAQGEQILRGSPLLMLLGTPADTPADWLAAGQALQHVLLRACADGLQASFLNQPLHLPELRQRIGALAPDAGVPQLLLRLGRPDAELAPVVRRPLDQVMDIDWMAH
jgi:hypothetical protein